MSSILKPLAATWIFLILTDAASVQAAPQGFMPASRTAMIMLSRVPNLITHIDRNLNTLQFINVAINPSNPAEVAGGTQDNGTWSNNNPVGDQNNWPQNIYGDGGNSGYDGANPTWDNAGSLLRRLAPEKRRCCITLPMPW